MPLLKPHAQIVVVGGGTGSSVVLSGLKSHPFFLTAIISMADSGGSTGRLRDEFGFQPVGDLRQALAALATSADENWIREILLYRFAKGKGLKGHNLGNLILTCLQDLTGSSAKAAAIASKIFRLHGRILPATLTKVELVITYQDGSVVIGEHHLNPSEAGGQKIVKISLSPRAKIYPPAAASLKSADLIVLAPGDLYASLLPNLIVSGMRLCFQKTQAKVAYVMNLMTVHTQTANFTAKDHVQKIEHIIERPLDYVILNSAPIPKTILARYQKQQEFPVIDDLPHTANIIRAPLITQTKIHSSLVEDSVPRSFLRHDPLKLAQILSTRL